MEMYVKLVQEHNGPPRLHFCQADGGGEDLSIAESAPPLAVPYLWYDPLSSGPR